MKPLLLALAVILFSIFATAQQEVPACSKDFEERPFAFGSSSRPLNQLSNSVFVAKRADIWIESRANNFRVGVTHNFKTGLKEFTCATFGSAVDNLKQKNFSFFGPVIFDRTATQIEGSTVWQFQVLVRGMQLGLWNQKSSLVKLHQILNQKEQSAWRWIEDGTGSVRIFKYDKVQGYDTILVIDLEKTK